MQQAIASFLDQHLNGNKQELLILGLSGGPDSLSLAHALLQLGYRFIAAHLNHQLRAESEIEAAFVRDFSIRVGVEFRSEKIRVLEIAQQRGLSLEETAREVRYGFLFKTAEEERASAVLVAHTADDQVETILMHFLRGAGLSGLRGMQPVTFIDRYGKSVPLLRPMLGIWREEVLDYCHINGLEPVFDRSNLDKTFFRNRLRHELIPQLESYNPKTRQAIHRMGDLLSVDYQVLQELVVDSWDQCIDEASDKGVRFLRKEFQSQPLGLRRALIRRAVGLLRPQLKDFGFHAVDLAVQFVDAPSKSAECDLASGLHVTMDGAHFWITQWGEPIRHPDLPRWKGGQVDVPLPGKVDLGSGWILRSEIISVDPAIFRSATSNTNGYICWADQAFFTENPTLRTRKKGERFNPLGMQGKSIKLADFFINVKMPRLARDDWPLICSKDQVIWVPGYRQSEDTRLTPQSKSACLLHLFQENPT